jgi:hypothetical protein
MLRVSRPNDWRYAGERSDGTIACRVALEECVPKKSSIDRLVSSRPRTGAARCEGQPKGLTRCCWPRPRCSGGPPATRNAPADRGATPRFFTPRLGLVSTDSRGKHPVYPVRFGHQGQCQRIQAETGYILSGSSERPKIALNPHLKGVSRTERLAFGHGR